MKSREKKFMEKAISNDVEMLKDVKLQWQLNNENEEKIEHANRKLNICVYSIVFYTPRRM